MNGAVIRRSAMSKKLAYAYVALILFGLLSPNLLDVGSTTVYGQLQYAESIGYGICFWLLWFAIFKRIWLGFAFAVIPALWLFPSIFLRWNYIVPINSTFFGIFADTNWQELYDFSTTMGPTFVIGLLLSVASVIIAACVSYRHGMSWSHRSRQWILLLLPALSIVLYLGFNQLELKDVKPTQKAFRVQPPQFWLEKWSTIFPTELYFSVDQYYQERKAIHELRREVDQRGFEGLIQNNAQAMDTVVLFIGESARSDRFGLYGYSNDTTPLLKARGDLLIMRDVVTPSIATRNSVPILISRRPLLGNKNAIDPNAEPSIISAFKKLGYATYWISNQTASGEFDTPIAFYASEAEHQRFLNPAQFLLQGTYDEKILPVTSSILSKPGKKFIVIHTMGSHFNYRHRYPDHFNIFQPSLTGMDASAGQTIGHRTQLSNSYDNSIRYTDFIINSVIKQLENSNGASMLLYTSDHGEDIYEKECKSMAFNRLSKASFKVPAFVWANPAAKQKNPIAFSRLESRLNSPMTTRVFFSVLSDLNAITIKPSIDGTRMDWSDTAWREGVRWVGQDYGVSVDFDDAAKKTPCMIVQNALGSKEKP
jgi:glucan phosphoethanolaminetransferase (alkaline phosphatase superfamily)